MGQGEAGAPQAPRAWRARLRRRPGLIAAALGALAALALARATPLVERLDEMAFDLQAGWARAGRDPAAALAPGADVVLVGIDDDSLDALGVPLAMIHAQLGAALQAIAAAGPRAIGLDLALPQQSFDPLLPGLDRELMRGLLAARAGTGVVLALDADALGRLRVPALPLLAAAGGPQSFGLTYFPLDCDGVVRRYEPDPGWVRTPSPCQSLGGAALDADGAAGAAPAAGPAAADPVLSTFAARLAERAGAGAALHGAGWIDYTRGAPLPYVPLREVVRWGRLGDSAALRARFAGQVVLVGSVLPYLDRLRLPVALAAWEAPSAGVPGLVVHAQVLRNALGHGLLQAPPPGLALLLVLALAALAAVRRAALRWALWLGALAGLLLGGAGLQQAGWFCAPSQALLTGIAAAALRTAADLEQERHERRRLTGLFGGYLSPQVLQALLRDAAAAAGTRRTIALLFADLRDFTAWSERADPALVMQTLNRYYGAVTPVLHAQGGTIDNFRGDGIMVMFGAPEALAQPCAAAFAAARALCAVLEEFNLRQRADGQIEFGLGIGLAYGEVVFGDLGSAERRDFTALGDAVNVAARLQDLSKQLEVPVLMTEAFARQLPAAAGVLRALGLREIKGHTPVAVCAWQPQPDTASAPA